MGSASGLASGESGLLAIGAAGLFLLDPETPAKERQTDHLTDDEIRAIDATAGLARLVFKACGTEDVDRAFVLVVDMANERVIATTERGCRGWKAAVAMARSCRTTSRASPDDRLHYAVEWEARSARSQSPMMGRLADAAR